MTIGTTWKAIKIAAAGVISSSMKRSCSRNHRRAGGIMSRLDCSARASGTMTTMSAPYHFSGVGGAGMSPLARLMRARGHAVQGSDRAFDAGKNTITGMVAWLAREAGAVAAVIGGAALVGEGGGGCLVPGPRDGAVAAEACESDGTLVGYHPALGLIHNVSRDHGELDWVRAQFASFAAQCGRLWVNARCAEASALGRRAGAASYGVGVGADAPVTPRALGPARATGVLRWRGSDVGLDVPQPGLHNLEHAAAAALVALELGIRPADVERLLPRFPGVARRFETIGVTRAGIRVIDDFAHNGEKIRAALTTAQAGAPRVVAMFQP